jgi:hydrogenase-4 component F
LICSVGIALALLGLFFLGIAASTVQSQTSSLNLHALVQSAPTMSRPWLRAAFVLALVGYGTKMGLAPMHTWLPDTHSQAPSPVSALLSGCLLNCALLAILRFFQVCLASGDVQFARTMLLGLGFLSMAVACAFMMGQRDYKRLFAYSSIENMGIIAIGFGLGGSATHGAIIHTVNHSICKAGLFMVAGNVLREFGTTDASQVQGMMRRLPVSGFLMMALLFAIGGAPPFGPFVSEWMIFQAAVNQSHPFVAMAFVCLVALCFLGMASVVLPMLQGESSTGRSCAERRLTVLAPLTMLAASFVLGIYLPPFLTRLTHFAAGTFGG